MASGSDGTETDTDSPYEHLKQFYTLANQDPDGKNPTFCVRYVHLRSKNKLGHQQRPSRI